MKKAGRMEISGWSALIAWRRRAVADGRVCLPLVFVCGHTDHARPPAPHRTAPRAAAGTAFYPAAVAIRCPPGQFRPADKRPYAPVSISVSLPVLITNELGAGKHAAIYSEPPRPQPPPNHSAKARSVNTWLRPVYIRLVIKQMRIKMASVN